MMVRICARGSRYSLGSCCYSDVSSVWQMCVPGRRWNDSGAGGNAGWNLVLAALIAVGTARDIGGSE